jgi:diadenylate cyclase
MSLLESGVAFFQSRTGLQLLRDAVDITLVYYLFYRLLLVARGTRAIQIATGLGILSLVYVVAQALELTTIVNIMGALLQSIILVIVVVFQSDIRRALQRVGSRAFFGSGRSQETAVIEEVVEAARELSRHRIGAIIAFEQEANLDEFVGQNKGVTLQARVTSELLVSLFVPEGTNKLHDGAVVIRDLRVEKAGVFFPMPEGRNLDATFGSRHRAALGITEETDAVVVVVSEERGTISFCFNGNIAPDLQANQLREMLISILAPKAGKADASAAHPPTTDRVSIRSQEPIITDAPRLAPRAAGSTPPPPLVVPHVSVPPTPLRKSSLPNQPTVTEEEETGSIKLPLAQPRPIPKANELEPLSEDPPSDPRSTPH